MKKVALTLASCNVCVIQPVYSTTRDGRVGQVCGSSSASIPTMWNQSSMSNDKACVTCEGEVISVRRAACSTGSARPGALWPDAGWGGHRLGGHHGVRRGDGA